MKAWTKHACQSKVLFSCLHSAVLFLTYLSSLIAYLCSLIARIFRVRREERLGYALDMTRNAKINFLKNMYCQTNQVQASVRDPGVGLRDTQVIDLQAGEKPRPDDRARPDGRTGRPGEPWGLAGRREAPAAWSICDLETQNQAGPVQPE